MSVPQYRAQLQEQQQEGETAAPAAADAPPADGAGDDDIISDILKADKGGKDKRRDEPKDAEPEPEVQEEPEPEEATPADDDDEEPETDIEAEPEPEVTGDLAAARAAADDGDLDKAFMIAFGKKPEDLLPNAYTWTKWRQHNERERKARVAQETALNTKASEFQNWAVQQRQQIHNTIEALKPYEKYYLAEQAFAKDGDPSHLVTIIEGIGKAPFNDVQKVILTKTRRSPVERQLQERLQELERKLTQTAAEREQQSQQVTEQQQYQADLGHIRQNVAGDVTKIPRFAERIYTILVKTRSPMGLTKTVEEAAAMVMRAERRRIENHPFVKKRVDESGKRVPPAVSGAARTLAARAADKNRPALRRDSQNNGARRAGDPVSDDDIINDILKPKKRSA